MATIVSHIAPAGPVCYGHSAVDSHAILPEGILVVSFASGHVFCLQLYRGSRRITVEECEHGTYEKLRA